MIEAKNISIQYKAEVPVRDLSFRVKVGEKVVLVGPSGSGKSSVLNAIPGFVALSAGNLIVDGVELSAESVNAIRKKLSWLPQELNLELENVDNLLYYPFTFKENRKKMPPREKVEEMLLQLNLEPSILTKKLSEISGGQKQRIALISVLLLNRPILLLDEPTSALDDDSTEKLIQLILSLKNTTVLSASHDKRWTGNLNQLRIEN